MTITAPELRALGLAVWGHEWQSPLARALGVNVRTVARWASGATAIPEAVSEKIRKVLGVGDTASLEWPRDEWIIGNGPPGEGGARREYIIHTRWPRFITRAVEVDENGSVEPQEAPADILTGVCINYGSGDMVLCEIVWIDPPPTEAALLKLMAAAADALG